MATSLLPEAGIEDKTESLRFRLHRATERKLRSPDSDAAMGRTAGNRLRWNEPRRQKLRRTARPATRPLAIELLLRRYPVLLPMCESR